MVTHSSFLGACGLGDSILLHKNNNKRPQLVLQRPVLPVPGSSSVQFGQCTSNPQHLSRELTRSGYHSSGLGRRGGWAAGLWAEPGAPHGLPARPATLHAGNPLLQRWGTQQERTNQTGTAEPSTEAPPAFASLSARYFRFPGFKFC